MSFFIFIFVYFLFSFSILGFGNFANRKIIKLKLNIGEQGLIGFFTLYTLSLILNFFFPLKMNLTLSILIIGNFLFFYSVKDFIKQIKFFDFIIVFLGILCAMTTNLHDDHLLYQLPYIDIKQNFKIIFGLVHINDFLTYTHGFYDTMAIFQLPFFENRLVFILPVIFFMFFVIIVKNFILKEKENIVFYFAFTISILILLKYTRSKEYGTDIPVIALIFLIQLYVLDFIKNKNYENFYKSIIFFSLAMFYKLYALFAFFYLIIFRKINFKEFFLKKKFLLIIILITGFLTISKSLVNSGCLSYPVSFTCVNNKIVKWSIHKEFVEFREKQTKAAISGWLPYIRSTGFKEMLMPVEYLEKFKYNYHKNVFLDPDREKLLIAVVISIFFILANLYFNRKNFKKKSQSDYFEISILSTLAVILWFILFPYSRYGGYAYLMFFIFLLSNSLSSYEKCGKKFFSFMIIFSIVFFSTKNLIRIKKEYHNVKLTKQNKYYPIPNFQKINFKEVYKNETLFNISNHKTMCGLIPFPCLPHHYQNLTIKIQKKLGYYFVYGDGKQRKGLLIKEIKINDFMRGRPGYHKNLIAN